MQYKRPILQTQGDPVSYLSSEGGQAGCEPQDRRCEKIRDMQPGGKGSDIANEQSQGKERFHSNRL